MRPTPAFYSIKNFVYGMKTGTQIKATMKQIFAFERISILTFIPIEYNIL